MTIRCRTGTEKCSSSQLDAELVDTLVAISVVSKRIAEKLNVLSKQEKNRGRRKTKWARSTDYHSLSKN